MKIKDCIDCQTEKYITEEIVCNQQFQQGWHHVYCGNCGKCTQLFADRAEAIEEWNYINKKCPTEFHIVKNPSPPENDYMPETFASSAADARTLARNSAYDMQKPWKKMYREGYRCVKVKITEI